MYFFRFEMPRAQMNAPQGEKDVRIAHGGGAKRGFTVCLCGLADGTKLPAYLVFKEKSGRIPPRVFSNLRIPDNIKVTTTPNGWMTRYEVRNYIKPLRQSLRKSPRQSLRKSLGQSVRQSS